MLGKTRAALALGDKMIKIDPVDLLNTHLSNGLKMP